MLVQERSVRRKEQQREAAMATSSSCAAQGKEVEKLRK